MLQRIRGWILAALAFTWIFGARPKVPPPKEPEPVHPPASRVVHPPTVRHKSQAMSALEKQRRGLGIAPELLAKARAHRTGELVDLPKQKEH